MFRLFDRKFRTYEELMEYEAIQKGVRKGLEQGLEQGRTEARREDLQQIWSKRPGGIPGGAEELMQSADAEQLAAAMSILLDGGSDELARHALQ